MANPTVHLSGGFLGNNDGQVQEGAATPEEQRQAYAAALQREVAGCDDKLAQLVDYPPEQWHIDRRREELLSEKDSALHELKLLGVKPGRKP